MIKLERGKKPDELTDELTKELTDKFKKDKTEAVWGKTSIKKALLKFSNNKCCYCEIALKEEGKYLTVDHFHHKDDYPDEVIKWDNLLPSCNHCNSNKGTHDTYRIPIIDPTKYNPTNYLYFENYRYKSIDKTPDSLGRTTIDVLYLNDSAELVMPRVKIGEEVQEKINNIYDKLNDYNPDSSDTRKKNKIVNSIRGLLKQTTSDNQYSALISTIIFEDADYIYIRNKLKEYGLWDNDLEQLEKYAQSICLSIHPLS